MRKEYGRSLKAAAALAVDGAFAFEDYLKFNETLTFSAEAKAILDAESYDDLLELIQTHIDEPRSQSKNIHTYPEKEVEHPAIYRPGAHCFACTGTYLFDVRLIFRAAKAPGDSGQQSCVLKQAVQ